MTSNFDVIIIGSGAGGGTLAHHLSATGKKILLIERGNYLHRERENWQAESVFVEARYQAKEVWHDQHGKPFHPGIHYYVGGNTKMYGAALLRLRREDFGEIRHHGGISPAWPLGYDDFERYYGRAEHLYQVHGEHGIDPTEPASSTAYLHPPVSHEPRIQTLYDGMKGLGYHPFPLPLGILLDEKDGKPTPQSRCVRCDAFDGYPCLVNGKADAQIICVDPALESGNVTLLTDTMVERLETDASGKVVSEVVCQRDGEELRFKADIVVVSCGAINSAALLLKSASATHPTGLANGSDVVGRHYMRHNNSAFMAIGKEPNPTVFQKTMALNDFYFGADDFDYPLGHIQMLGKTHEATIRSEAPRWLLLKPQALFQGMATHSVDFWLTSEDLPNPNNRITLDAAGKVVLSLTEANMEGHIRLQEKLRLILKALDFHPHLLPHYLYLGQNIPIGGTAHQNGTIRFGTDPATSALDLNCKAHQLDNLYVVDASFFPSCGAVNPTLTIIANALRVGDHLTERLG
jgi:choline dehydrogenase-like flavoprotein